MWSQKKQRVYVRMMTIKSTLELASVDLIRGVQKQRVNNKINWNRKNPRKSAGRGLILGSTSNLFQRPQNMHLYRVLPISNVKFWK